MFLLKNKKIKQKISTWLHNDLFIFINFKSYFTCFEAFPIDRYLSDPYLSSASGNLCRTLAVKKYNEKKDEYIILCMDFIEETIKSPIP